MTAEFPAVYGISACKLFENAAAFLKRLEKTLRDGRLRLFQIREKHMRRDEFEDFASSCVELCKTHGCKVLVNHVDREMAKRVGADGLHLPSGELGKRPATSDFSIVGASCHGEKQLEDAFENQNADFAVLSPVLRTLSHVDAKPLGWELFRELAKKHARPVYALGGLKIGDLETARENGAVGVASMRDVWGLSVG